MRELITLYFGTIMLMYLSQMYCPLRAQGLHRGSGHFFSIRFDIFTFAVFFLLFSFFFLRTSYNDTANYILFWRNSATVEEFVGGGGLLDLTGNPLSRLWESFSHEYLGNYHLYFLPPALLINYATVKLIKRYSVSPAFSILVFFSIGTCIMFMAAMKQCLAMFFLLMSIPYAEKKQYGRFYLLVAVAILFHTHAFMFAILPFLFEKPWGKITWAGIAAVLFMTATYDVTLGAFMEYAQSIGALVDESELFDGHQINFLRVVVYWIPSLLALAFRPRLFHDSSRMDNLFVNMSTVSACILTLGTVQAANLFARMAAYFELAQAIALPWMVKKLFNRPSQRLVFGVAAVCYFGYFLYEFGISKYFGQQYAAISWWQFLLELVRG